MYDMMLCASCVAEGSVTVAVLMMLTVLLLLLTQPPPVVVTAGNNAGSKNWITSSAVHSTKKATLGGQQGAK